ncbi:ABC transporter permease [Chloracidobacterium sp. MS 40/45]|uniref:ABC transporter permease n=1 Tax=Chloracidobacterium aggregatum TaxID=2851959 RepID=UPI001B8AA833|nr:ABC transporter permease [Chloracidobacterium aggregatum]QUW00104.1 ABC transporter permease [Chloracidobacterium sp. MS 40/45]
MGYVWFIAQRYIRARRRATLSVAAGLAVLGITVGVWALTVVLAFQSGMEAELQGKILAGTAHLNVLRRGGRPLPDPAGLKAQIQQTPGVRSATPTTYREALLTSGSRAAAGVLKAVDLAEPPETLDVTRTLCPGTNLKDLQPTRGPEGRVLDGIIPGKRLAQEAGLRVGDLVEALTPGARGELSPFGWLPTTCTFRVVGFFESGLYEYDAAWAYISLDAARQLTGEEMPATVIQVMLDDARTYREVGAVLQARLGSDYVIEDWATLNRTAFAALNLQRLAFAVVIGLVILVAALNIVTTLMLLVTEKRRDIAILLAMGATPRTILLVFLAQGLALGLLGALCGGLLGAATAIVCDRYELIQLDARMYSIAAVPFRFSLLDTGIVLGVALSVSLLATLYPAWRAATLNPVDGLRHA